MLFVLAACAATPSSAPSLPFSTTAVGTVEEPTAVVPAPGSSTALWVTEQAGRIVRIDGGVREVVLDIHERVVSGGELGLLGLAVSPRWPADPRVFVNYTWKDDAGLHSRIAAFTLSADARTADPTSEESLLTYAQPWSNHNSGAMAFGPDGMLYLGVGDGGSGGDPRKTGQDRSDLLGSILRVDVATHPYAVPPDNPFVGQEGVRPELWAYGVRNPWGMHFDGATLWFADVGQDTWEEVDQGVRGGNYGWSLKEATHCFKAETCAGDFVEPVAEYRHQGGASVTGGLVYRGPSIPALDGAYLYADFATGAFWTLRDGVATQLGTLPMSPAAFGEDGQHRVYVADYRGTLWRFGPPS